MAGYSGYSMSNNAVLAYEDGEKPFSKWRKTDIIDAIQMAVKRNELVLNCHIEKIKKLPAKTMKEICLYRTSWHHTSSYYNKTDFFSLDMERIETLTNKEIEKIIKDSKEQERKKIPETEELWKCAFLEWSGTRKHPKATEIIEVGTIKGCWFFRADGSKKKITANGFRKIKKID